MRWRLALLLTAALALVVPPSGTIVERWYSSGLFPPLQRIMTALSNQVPFAMFDVLLIAVIGGVCVATALDLKRRRRRGWILSGARIVGRLAIVGAAAYLAFLLLWGLNYRRVSLPARTAFETSRISPDNARRLGDLTVTRVNALYSAAHAETPTPNGDVDARLAHAFVAAQPVFAASTPFRPGRPKRTLLDFYFRRAGVAGMTDPYFLETLIASDLLPVERPMVTAHEWGHLAGLGDEGEANFAGFLACLRGSALHQYSGWLSLYSDVVGGLRQDEAARVAQALDPGPRADLQAIRERLLRQINPAVSAAGWRVYDQYLKANRVDEGTNSYSDVVRLVLGTQAVKF